MSDLEESSKAVAEVAKFGTASVEAAGRLCGFFAKVLGEPFQDAVGLLSDKLKLLRFENQVVIMDKVNRILDERGVVNTRPIPPKFAIPIMEYASLEEDESLQDIWCKLLANSLDPTRNFEVKYFHIEIIKSLMPLDALLLKYIYDDSFDAASAKYAETKRPVRFDECPVSFEKIKQKVPDKQPWETRISLCNLMRVQCVEEVSLYELIEAMKSDRRDNRFEEGYSLTSLGFNFIQSCMK